MTSHRSVPTHGPPPRSHLFVGSGGGRKPGLTPPRPPRAGPRPPRTPAARTFAYLPSSHWAGRPRPAPAKQRGAAYQGGHGQRIGHAATPGNFGEPPQGEVPRTGPPRRWASWRPARRHRRIAAWMGPEAHPGERRPSLGGTRGGCEFESRRVHRDGGRARAAKGSGAVTPLASKRLRRFESSRPHRPPRASSALSLGEGAFVDPHCPGSVAHPEEFVRRA